MQAQRTTDPIFALHKFLVVTELDADKISALWSEWVQAEDREPTDPKHRGYYSELIERFVREGRGWLGFCEIANLVDLTPEMIATLAFAGPPPSDEELETRLHSSEMRVAGICWEDAVLELLHPYLAPTCARVYALGSTTSRAEMIDRVRQLLAAGKKPRQVWEALFLAWSVDAAQITMQTIYDLSSRKALRSA